MYLILPAGLVAQRTLRQLPRLAPHPPDRIAAPRHQRGITPTPTEAPCFAATPQPGNDSSISSAAVHTIQLVEARDESEQPTSDVAMQISLVLPTPLAPKLECSTAHQKIRIQRALSLGSPGSPPALADGKAAGPKTVGTGWNRPAAIVVGYALGKWVRMVALRHPVRPSIDIDSYANW